MSRHEAKESVGILTRPTGRTPLSNRRRHARKRPRRPAESRPSVSDKHGRAAELEPAPYTKGNQIDKLFVIFVCFVVDKLYNVLVEPRLPLRSRPPSAFTEPTLC